VNEEEDYEVCCEHSNGIHFYKNNICSCGRVVEVIEEDEEEDDFDGGVLCSISETGNHHFELNSKCKYCGSMRSRRTTLRKKNSSILEIPPSYASGRLSNGFGSRRVSVVKVVQEGRRINKFEININDTKPSSVLSFDKVDKID